MPPSTTVTGRGGARARARARFVLWGDSITQQGFSCPPAGGGGERGGEGAGAGWCARLADAYSRTADVVLRGYSGYNTEWARSVLLPHIFEDFNDGDDGGDDGDDKGDGKTKKKKNKNKKASLVTVFFGANDAALPDRFARKQHVPLERFRENLRALIEASVEAATTDDEAGGAASGGGGEGLVVVITPPPVDEAARVRHALSFAKQSSNNDNKSEAEEEEEEGKGDEGTDPLLHLPERTDDAAGEYARAAVDVVVKEFQGRDEETRRRVREGSDADADADADGSAAPPAAAVRVEVLDLYGIFKGSDCPSRPWTGLLSDGLHLSAAGNELLFSSLMSLVAERAPHLLPGNLLEDFPDRLELEALHEVAV